MEEQGRRCHLVTLRQGPWRQSSYQTEH